METPGADPRRIFATVMYDRPGDPVFEADSKMRPRFGQIVSFDEADFVVKLCEQTVETNR